ncbi:hypothetical protein [Aldersonia kunmingensis]|nr:hypothetical protein [Aldersonia kunmingensis]
MSVAFSIILCVLVLAVLAARVVWLLTVDHPSKQPAVEDRGAG